jgi:hypothetical protein
VYIDNAGSANNPTGTPPPDIKAQLDAKMVALKIEGLTP